MKMEETKLVKCLNPNCGELHEPWWLTVDNWSYCKKCISNIKKQADDITASYRKSALT